MSPLDPDVCYRALETRDRRFDGRFFVGVTSTGIYCRPICPAGPAHRKNCRFFLSAASAQKAGFRPCLRCRPEVAPELGSWRGTSNTVTRGLSLIADGALDGDDASVDALAERLGVGARQLRRLFQQHLGASPIAVAQTRRLLFAKHLIHDTRLPMAEVALAAGFGSVRRFNETFRALFARPPSDIRRRVATPLPEGSVATSGVTVRLRYRPPYDWPAMLAFLRPRAIEGVERVVNGTYRRTIQLDGMTGSIEVAHVPAVDSLSATIRTPDVRTLPRIVTRIRQTFDLGADVGAIGAQLSVDPMLSPLVKARPGLRTPGSWDGFEVAMRAVLGQQVTVEAGRRLTEQLVRLCGTRVSADPSEAFVFPTAAQVVQADLSTLKVPRTRAVALASIAAAALDDERLFERLATVEDTVARLSEIRGVGDWTAHYIALRAAGEPDAFPAGDVGLLRSATPPGRVRLTPSELGRRAENWRPWRGYAAQHLWTAEGSVM